MIERPVGDNKQKEGRGGRPNYVTRVGASATRKIRARRNPAQGIWFGLGMIGLVGWSIVVPTLAGAALGHWLDSRHVTAHSWTLALLVAGLVLGCANAWNWIAAQDQAMRDEQSDDETSGDM